MSRRPLSQRFAWAKRVAPPTDHEREKMRRSLEAAIAEELAGQPAARDPGEIRLVGTDQSRPRRQGWATIAVTLMLALTLLPVGFYLSTQTGPPPTSEGQSDPPNPRVQATWTTSSLEAGSLLAHDGAEFIKIEGGQVTASKDGLQWIARGQLDEGVHLVQIVHDNGRLVGLGWIGPDGLATPDTLDYGAWFSGNGGATWERTDLDAAPVRSIGVFPGGFVAIGVAYDDSTIPHGSVHGAVWTSGDGRRWQLTAISADPPGTSSEFHAMAWSEDKLHLYGRQGTTQPPEEGLPYPGGSAQLLWRSPDGRTLEAPMATDFNRFSDQIVPTTQGFAAVARLSGEFLTSPDGVSWTRNPVAAHNVDYTSLAASQTAVIVAGYPASTSAQGNGSELWMSNDGTTWNIVEMPVLSPSYRITQLLLVGDTILFVASEGSSGVLARGELND